MRSIIAVVVVLLCLFPFAKNIYAALAAPLLKALPVGGTMIATDVTGTFLVPLKVTLMTRIPDRAALCAAAGMARLSRRGFIITKSGWRCR